jgi:hypothetical protein
VRKIHVLTRIGDKDPGLRLSFWAPISITILHHWRHPNGRPSYAGVAQTYNGGRHLITSLRASSNTDCTTASGVHFSLRNLALRQRSRADGAAGFLGGSTDPSSRAIASSAGALLFRTAGLRARALAMPARQRAKVRETLRTY